MREIAAFETTPDIANLSAKERGIPLVTVAIFSFFGMAAFLFQSVSFASMQQIVPFVTSLMLAIICAIVGFCCWRKFAKREHAHINDSVKSLRDSIRKSCVGVVDDEDVIEWIVERVWECFCGNLIDEQCVAYLIPLPQEEKADEGAKSQEAKSGQNELEDDARHAYVLHITRETKTAHCKLFYA